METMVLKYNPNTREERRVKVNLETNTKAFQEENIESRINEYEEYVREKDSSTRYRLAFTISPICSNVLYNALTEIVYKEGSDDCVVIPHCKGKNIDALMSGSTKWGYGSEKIPADASKFWATKYGGESGTCKLNTVEMIRDTSYSHPDIGNFVYHCGIDIFNNHLLRKNENIVINKIGDEKLYPNFNTIADICRDDKGKTIVGLTTSLNKDEKSEEKHVYFYDTIKRFPIALRDGIKEDSNGWWGFINPCTLPIVNYGENIVLNKCMNNNKSGEFYDFYPDRSLYTFTPKYNKYRNRYENNWDYCLTFPYRNVKNDVVYNEIFDVTGIKVYLESEIKSGVTIEKLRSDSRIYFRTDVNHNLNDKSQVELTLIYDNSFETIPYILTVESLGSPYGDDLSHYFSIAWDSIEGYINEILSATEIRLRRKENGVLCDYYFRVFRKVPNFNFTDVSQEEDIREEDFAKAREFNSNLNTLGFGRNVYDMDISQIVYNDIVDVKGLRDNLNREVSELYLTVVKNNKGHDEWYHNEKYSSSSITYSHCFGKVTCGLDLTRNSYDYNIHTLHNIDLESTGGTKYRELVKEWDENTTAPLSLTIDSGNTKGVTIDDSEFLGDLVEFSPNTIYETVLERVYHRFNTMQRELTLSKTENDFRFLIYEDIVRDDNDRDIMASGDSNVFSTKFDIFNKPKPNSKVEDIYPANLNHEGYWYNPHYHIKIKEYSDEINEGFHTKISLDSENESVISGDTIILHTDKNYYLEIGKVLYFYNKNKKKKVITIQDVDKNDYRHVSLINDGITDLTEWVIFKPNIEKPKYAYDFEDGTGRYIWRNVLSTKEIFRDSELYDTTFTNNATYIHKNINLFLKRQNPFGEYPKLDTYLANVMTPDGKANDYRAKYYVKEEDYDRC